jgi:hypothetical protein
VAEEAVHARVETEAEELFRVTIFTTPSPL